MIFGLVMQFWIWGRSPDLGAIMVVYMYDSLLSSIP